MADLGQALGGAASTAASGAGIGTMIAPGIGTAIGAVGGGLVGALGGLFGGSGDQDAAKAAQQAALQQILGVDAPTAQQLAVKLQGYQNVGNLSAATEGTISQGPSAMNGVSTDPRLKQAQMLALAQMGQTAQGGLNSTDRSALTQIGMNSAQQNQAQQDSILQNMAARGMGGSGNELAARLSASQNASNQALTQGNTVAAQAQARALDAMSQYGGMATGIQGQQFGQQAQVAGANDAISRFNAANAQQVMGSNTQYQNWANQANWQNAQNVANMNTGVANQQAQYNSQMTQQAYADQMQRAQAAAGQYGNNSQYDQNQAAQKNNMWSGIGQGVIGAAGSYANYANQQANTDWMHSYLNKIADKSAAAPSTSSSAFGVTGGQIGPADSALSSSNQAAMPGQTDALGNPKAKAGPNTAE